MAWMTFQPCFLAVEMKERMAAKSVAPAKAFPEKTESGGIPLRRRIGFKNHTGEEASMGWGSRIRKICVGV